MSGKDLIHGAVVVGSVFLTHFLTSGWSIAMGAYYVTFLEVFQRSHGVTAWIGSLNFAVLCLMGPLASVMISRCGCAWTVLTGGLISAIGLVISSFAQSIHVIFVSHGVITGCGYGLCFASGVVLINTQFSQHRALAMGLSISGVGVGACIYPFIFSLLTEAYGWRGALMISGGLTLHCCVAGVMLRNLIVASQEDAIALDVDSDENSLQHSCDSNCNCDYCSKLDCDVCRKACDSCDIPTQGTFKDGVKECCKDRNEDCAKVRESCRKDCDIPNKDYGAYTTENAICHGTKACLMKGSKYPSKNYDLEDSRALYDSVTLIEQASVDDQGQTSHYVFFTSPHYWLLHLNCILYCFGQSVVFTHIMAYGESETLSANEGAALISAIGFANIGGRIALGAICSLPRVNLILLLSLCYCSAGLAILLCTLSSSFMYMLSLMLLFGFGSGAFGPVVCEVCCRIVGVKDFATAYGFLLISMGTGTLIGAPIAGELYDWTEVYANSIYLGAGVLVSSGLVVLPSCLHVPTTVTHAADEDAEQV